MKRIVTALAFLALLVLSVGSAFGLSDADYKKMMKDKDFARADKALTQAWNKAKKAFPATKAGKAAYQLLLADQREWIKSGRDADAQDLMGMEGYSKLEAYAEVTRERAKYLPTLVKEYLEESSPKKAAPKKPEPKPEPKPKPKAGPEKPAPKPRKETPKPGSRDDEEFLTESARREAAGDWHDTYPDTGVCVGNSVRLRADPDTESEIVGRLNEGDRVITLEETSVDGQKWYAVDHPTQEGTAWVSARYIETYKGYEIGTPAYNMSIQIMMNFGLRPEKARVLLGDPNDTAKEKFFFDPANQELTAETLEYDDCKVQYVEGRLTSIEVWERGVAFGAIKVGDPTSKLTNTLGAPSEEAEDSWRYDVDPRGSLIFVIEDGKISRMLWGEAMDG